VADALAHAHARLIVHRDVKPENILLTADGAPVLVDFGLALDEAHAGGRSKGIVSGTPVYMSPEQAVGTAHRIDGRTDVYSLGVVLYELLTGRLPFQAEDTRELLRQVREDEPQPPRQLVRDVPPELERACLKALAKRQQDRYTTAADFADDLRRVLPPAAEAPGVTPRAGLRAATPAPARPDAHTPSSSRRRTGEAERRQVTVLVCGCDLFESEAYLDGLDAEDQARVLRAFQQACADAVGRFDGTVVRCNEQGLLACFGYPVAYEDAAGRAARTGLALLEDLKALAERFRREQKLELYPWVGLHTGPAVVEAGESTVSLVGEARSVAVRLEDVAAAGQVLCTEATHRLIGGQLQCKSLGRRKIKGVAQPVELFRVGGIGAARSPVEAAGPAGLTPLTGRDHEISLLMDRWEQTREGMGQVVLLTGEPGLGKSRLVYTLKEHVLGQMVEGEADAPVIEWRCAPHFQNTGLYPAIDFYERALGFGREEPPPARFDRLLHRLEQYDLARPEVVPLWAALLSLPVPDRYPALSLSPVRQREETFRAMLEWLQVRAGRKPVVFVAEDLHWADASTLEFLGLFLAEGRHDRVLAVLTFRPEFRPPWPAAARQTSLALNPLTRRQVGDLMRHRTGGAVPEALVGQIYDRTGGVPLFVEEFTQMVQESGALGQAEEGGAPAGALPPHEIPATLQDLVMARLEHLGGGREVAQLAATLGREFSHELLAAVAALEEPTLQAELAGLVQAEILYPKGRPPRCSYVFKHALLEDALYNALVKAKRQQLHRRIAEVLEAQFPQTVLTQPELLAHHFTEAGLAAKGLDYWLKAGLRSRERSAEVEAIGHLTRGLALLETLDESAERDLRELDLLIPLGTATIAARGYAAPEVGPVFRRARERCERVGQPPQRFALLLGIWEWHTVRADLRLCTDLAAEGMEFARRHDDPGMVMEALFMAGETLLYRADFAGARDRFATAVAEYDDRARTRFWAGHTSHNAGVTCRSNLAVALWHLGYPDQALRVNREMCQLAREIGHPFSLAYALHHTAWLCHLCRLGAEVKAAAEEELAIATEQGFALWRATGTFFRGAGMLLQGEREEALPLLVKGLQAFRAGGSELTLPSQLGTLGDAHARAGRFDEARRALDEGLALAEKHDERFQEAELHRLKGELLLAECGTDFQSVLGPEGGTDWKSVLRPDQAAAAEDCFRQAIETARRQQSRAWELRATMSLARLRQRQGRRDEARDALAAVHGTYTEGFTTPDLMDAAALLETLTRSQPSAVMPESRQSASTPAIWDDSSLELNPVVLPESLVGAPQPAAGDRTTEAWAGKSLGKYQITGVLGRGGMGVVLKARDLMIERDVAIKVLAGHLTTDVAALGRFLAEARAAGRLNHPNVTAIYEIGQERQTHYLVLEYVAGGSLQDRLAGEKPLAVPEATQALIDACKGVGAAHAAGLIHRDIKPANFMRAADGSIKVTDFGLAKSAANSGLHFTRTGMVVGTPFYMSPEQCEAKPLDHRSDLYALGATYYTLLTGKHPYHETESAVQLMYLHCHGPVLDPRSVNPAVPEACARVVGRAMAKAPAERYQSAAEMLADLQAVAAALAGQTPVPSPAAQSIPPSAPGGGAGSAARRRRIRWAIAGVSLVALVAVAVLSWRGVLHDRYTGRGNGGAAPESEAAPTAGEGPPVIAVLPFVNTAADPETEYLRDGIPGALLKKLSEVAHLTVRPYGGAPKKPDEELDLRAVGRQLDAQAVLTGRVRLSRDRLSLHVELVSVRENRPIWVEQYERLPADLQDVETDIAQHVCARLGVSPSREEERRLARRDTADPEAYRLYLRGRHHMLQSNLEGMSQSVACFKQAIARDPKYALAHAGLADTYGYYAGDWVPYDEALPLQKAAARKALDLDDDLAEAHLAMGNVFMGQDYDWPAAEQEFQRAIALKPRLDLAHDGYAQFLAFQGRFEESTARQKEALEINPFSPYLIANLGYLFYVQRRYDRALEQARKALAIDPNYVSAHDYLGAAYLRQGPIEEALGEIRKCRQLDDVPWYLARLAAAQAVAGNQGEARTLLKELQELSKRRQVTPECYFLVYVGLGERDQAFAWLQRMVDVRSQYPLRLKVDPTFDGLRDDPRFADWLRRLKLAP
jgi:serine/threonine protein kinase/TolB-like protein/tetratricopeptide (TPR) repeat protein